MFNVGIILNYVTGAWLTYRRINGYSFVKVHNAYFYCRGLWRVILEANWRSKVPNEEFGNSEVRE